MPKRPDIPQMSLDFDKDESGEGQSKLVGSNVVQFAPKQAIQRRSAADISGSDPGDSVLQELLTNARKLNW